MASKYSPYNKSLKITINTKEKDEEGNKITRSTTAKNLKPDLSNAKAIELRNKMYTLCKNTGDVLSVSNIMIKGIVSES